MAKAADRYTPIVEESCFADTDLSTKLKPCLLSNLTEEVRADLTAA